MSLKKIISGKSPATESDIEQFTLGVFRRGHVIECQGIDVYDVTKCALKLHATDYTGMVYIKSGHKYHVTEETVKRIAHLKHELIQFREISGLTRWLKYKNDEDDETYKQKFWEWVLG